MGGLSAVLLSDRPAQSSIRRWSASLSSWYTASSHFCRSSSSLVRRIPCKVKRLEQKESTGLFFHQRLVERSRGATHSYGMTLNTKWSSKVSCSAISRAEWFSKGSAFPPTYQTQKNQTTTGLWYWSGNTAKDNKFISFRSSALAWRIPLLLLITDQLCCIFKSDLVVTMIFLS